MENEFDKYIDGGKYYLDGKFYQIFVFNNIKKYYRISSFDSKDYVEVTEEEFKKLDSIFNPKYTGIISLVESNPELTNVDSRVPKEYVKTFHEFNFIFVIFLSKYVDKNYRDKINSVKVITNEEEKIPDTANGIYDVYNNTIYLRSVFSPQTLNHELLHMSSINNGSCGFYNPKINVGIGLNEYATQYVCCNCFKCRKGYFDSYDYEIMSSIESLIGKRDFMKSFFSSSIHRLSFLLLQYSSKKEIIELYILMDDYYYTYLQRKKYLKENNIELAHGLDKCIEDYKTKISLIIDSMIYKKNESESKMHM